MRIAKCRWKSEQDYHQLKKERGWDHYPGRSWNGWHHHLTLVMLAYSFLTLGTLRSQKLLGGPCRRRGVKSDIGCSPGSDTAPIAEPAWATHGAHCT
ncbi:MAG: hypothetical protein ACRD2O_07035 [Terriglobia bacterium]